MSFDASTVEVRHLAEPDIDALIEIGESLAEAPRWSREQYVDALWLGSARRRVSLVACNGRSGEVVGFAVAGLVPPEAELESIAVARDAQRHGLGRQLLIALVGELTHAGVEELLLEVRASNVIAIRFYEAQNFKQTGVRARYYADPEEDAVLMALQIA
jgi:ribosomal-protein-alanine N-acetyltransferase